MSGVIVAPRVRDLETLAGQLSAWLLPRLPGASDLRIENLTYPRGAGRSHETILFDAVWTVDGQPRQQGMVVRIKPSSDHLVYPDDLFDEQHQLMSALSAGGHVPVAKPLWVEQDPSLLGAPFFVMEKVLGRVAVSIPPYSREGWLADATPAQRAKVWENGVRALASIQKVPVADLGFLAGPDGLTGLEQEFAKYVRFLAWIGGGERWPVLQAALENLRARWPKNQPAGLVWGDARLGNLMFNDHFEVVAIMDWEQPSLGGALNDLAWWTVMSANMHEAMPGRPHMEGMGTREETIQLWRDVTGISTDDLDWYVDFTLVKVGCLSTRVPGTLTNAPPPDHSGLAKALGLSVGA